MNEYTTDLNYEDDIKIDKENLHKEWLKQPSISYEYKKHYINLKKLYQLKYEELKTIRSQLIKEANEDPDGCCGKSKPNAGDIEAYYRDHKKYKKIKEELIEVEYEMNMAEVAKDEIAFTKKKALEELGILWKAEYYAIPNLPKNFGEEIAQKTSKSMRRKNGEK